MSTAAHLLAIAAVWYFFGFYAALRTNIIPVFFVFPIAFTLNRLGQHYDIDPTDPAKWGTLMRGHWFWDFAFLNSNYHLEHHYFPGVPFYRLPRLQRALVPFYERKGTRWQTYGGLLYGWFVENRAPHTDWSVEPAERPGLSRPYRAVNFRRRWPRIKAGRHRGNAGIRRRAVQAEAARPSFFRRHRGLRSRPRERDAGEHGGGADHLSPLERLPQKQHRRGHRHHRNQVRVGGGARAADLTDRDIPDRVGHAEREQRRIDAQPSVQADTRDQSTARTCGQTIGT